MVRSFIDRPRAIRYTNAPSHGMTMMNKAQSALPHPDSSWSRKMSAKIVMSSQIQANRSMNQKIDKMMSQKFTADSDLDGRGGRSLRIVSIAESGPGSLTLTGRSRRDVRRRPNGMTRTGGSGDPRRGAGALHLQPHRRAQRGQAERRMDGGQHLLVQAVQHAANVGVVGQPERDAQGGRGGGADHPRPRSPDTRQRRRLGGDGFGRGTGAHQDRGVRAAVEHDVGPG